MRPKNSKPEVSAEREVKDIRRTTRRQNKIICPPLPILFDLEKLWNLCPVGMFFTDHEQERNSTWALYLF